MEQVGYPIRDNLTIPVVQMFQTLQGASNHPDMITSLENFPDTLDYALLRRTSGYKHIQKFFQALRIIVVKTKSEISEKLIREIVPPLIGVGLFFLTIMVVGFLVLIRLIIRPLSEASTNLEVLSSGEGDLTSRLPVRSSDELGHLSGSFNLFVTKLADMIGNIKKALDNMEEIKENILSSAEETTGAVEQISANISSMGDQMHNLDENVVGNSLNNVSQVTVSKKNITGKLGAVALEGKKQLNETSQAFKNVVENMERIKKMANTIYKQDSLPNKSPFHERSGRSSSCRRFGQRFCSSCRRDP